ncbi:hypothetical protein [Thetidibacter halocola]|uniref:DUF4402 domain-containing protein n=1 Tax=Thetidibacter halocola TaxID=2827239 RepID=A0A8J8BAG1_9RHOB|nr:hypothetical protein [Thetidibacter halocola]MBS0126525.1 hypothetical protein [Thetidibacter halocola]
MKAIVVSAAILFFPATPGLTQQLTTTVETTVTISEEDMTTATFAQLVRAIRSFDGSTLNVSGQMYSNPILEDEFTVVVEDGLSFEIKLDDGRQVTQRARQCPSAYSRRASAGCQVTLDIELDVSTDGYPEFVRFSGVGFNVNFQ